MEKHYNGKVIAVKELGDDKYEVEFRKSFWDRIFSKAKTVKQVFKKTCQYYQLGGRPQIINSEGHELGPFSPVVDAIVAHENKKTF